MTVSFVVPTFHRPRALQATLEALLVLDYPPASYEIIVVDNADEAAAAAVVARVAAAPVDVQYVMEAKPGAAAARNRGARVASGDVLIFCDDDMIVEPSHIELHLQTQERFGRCLVNGDVEFAPETLDAFNTTPFGRYRKALDVQFRQESRGRSLGDAIYEIEALSGQNLAVSRELFWELDGFDEDFPFAGAEDREFSMRAVEAGCLLIRNDRIRALHNDQWITFAQFCIREERSAQTMAVLTRKRPEFARGRPFAAVNGPISRQDTFPTLAKKCVKLALNSRVMLQSTHAVVRLAEAAGLGERMLRRLYTGVVGVHIFRGFRSAL